MLDIHCHLLPGLDDGAEDMATAIEMAQLLVAGGWTAVATSPHMGGGPGGDVSETAASAAREALQAELKHRGIDLALLPGGEHHITPDIFTKADAGALTPIGGRGRYLLVEFPWGGLPGPESVLFKLRLKGFKLVLAHPERYGFLDPSLAISMAHKGVLLQLELGSFVGMYGDRALQRAIHLAEAGAAHVLATDLHRPDDAEQWLKEARDAYSRRFGSASLLRGLRDNPQLFVNDAPLEEVEPL